MSGMQELDIATRLRGFLEDIITQYGIGQTVSGRDAHLYRTPLEGGEAPFDVMLRYSTQKAVNAWELASQIEALNGGRSLDILDIGTSKGTMWGMLVGRLNDLGHKAKIHFTLLEPDKDSIGVLREYAKAISDITRGRFTSTIVQAGWEEFKPSKYDAIIASHVLYHFERDQLPYNFRKMKDALKPATETTPAGRAFIIAREREGNETLEQIHHYKAMAGKEHFNDLTIEDAEPWLAPMMIGQKELFAKVYLPFASNVADAQTVFAFFLNRPSWDAIPEFVQDDIMARYGGTDHELVQLDRLVEIG